MITDDPSMQIKGPKTKRKLPNNLSEDDVNRLLEAAMQTGRNATDKRRTTALMQILYARNNF